MSCYRIYYYRLVQTSFLIFLSGNNKGSNLKELDLNRRPGEICFSSIEMAGAEPKTMRVIIK